MIVNVFETGADGDGCTDSGPLRQLNLTNANRYTKAKQGHLG